ncbi:MAG: hypothetical protein JNN30_17495 [Rhodanobacteraceae bacterium]|nr:hypothetical protein [Rhodanobacteraceae bacterium]
MTTLRRPRQWPIVALSAATIATAAVIAALVQRTPGTGAWVAIRLTAHTSAALFTVAFAASALYARWPGSFTRWLSRYRRGIGLSFAASHAVHAAAILALYRVDTALFNSLVDNTRLIGGSFVYVFIALMAATSNDASQRLLGRNWRRLHLVGSYIVYFTFLRAFVRMAMAHAYYWGFVAVLLLVLGLRLWPKMRRASAA